MHAGINIFFCITANENYMLFWSLYYAILEKKTTKQGYKHGHGSHLYQVLCECHIYWSARQSN